MQPHDSSDITNKSRPLQVGSLERGARSGGVFFFIFVTVKQPIPGVNNFDFQVIQLFMRLYYSAFGISWVPTLGPAFCYCTWILFEVGRKWNDDQHISTHINTKPWTILDIYGNTIPKNATNLPLSELCLGFPCYGTFLPRPFAGRTSETIVPWDGPRCQPSPWKQQDSWHTGKTSQDCMMHIRS